MMQNQIIQPEIYFYRKCFKETQTTNPQCPQCGRNMQTQAQIKSLGLLLIILGILISLGCGLGVLLVIALLLFAKLPEKDVVMAVIGFVWTGAGLAMGIITIIGGVWQKKHGRASKLLMWVILGLFGFMIFIGGIFSILKA